MIKSGVRQLDGKGKWNIMTMSRVVMMLFDEEEICLDGCSESLEELLAGQQDGDCYSSSSSDDEGETSDDDVVEVYADADVDDRHLSPSDNRTSPSNYSTIPLLSTATKPPPTQCDNNIKDNGITKDNILNNMSSPTVSSCPFLIHRLSFISTSESHHLCSKILSLSS